MKRIGKYYKLFSMEINSITYYFIGSIKNGGYRWVYTDYEKAVDTFETHGRYMIERGEI